MNEKKSNTPTSALVAAMERTKAHCEAIAYDPENHQDLERKAASIVAGQLSHWIFDATDAPVVAPGKAASSDMARHRLNGLKVSATLKIEELIEGMAQIEHKLVVQAQLIDDITGHIKQLNLPAELKARLLAGASAESEVEATPKAAALSRTILRSGAKVRHPSAAC